MGRAAVGKPRWLLWAGSAHSSAACFLPLSFQKAVCEHQCVWARSEAVGFLPQAPSM